MPSKMRGLQIEVGRQSYQNFKVRMFSHRPASADVRLEFRATKAVRRVVKERKKATKRNVPVPARLERAH